MADKPEPPDEPGCPLWMLTFGDAMSLLVTFFVMLIAMSDFEEHKLSSMMGALKGGFSLIEEKVEGTGTADQGDMDSVMGTPQDEIRVALEQLSKISQHAKVFQRHHTRKTLMHDNVEFYLEMLKAGLTMVVKANSLFEPGTCDYYEGREEVLYPLADLAAVLDNEIRIVGIVPIDTQVDCPAVHTPWGLCGERARAVMQTMAHKARLQTNRFSLCIKVTSLNLERVELSEEERQFTERVEILLVGLHKLNELTVEETIVKEKWDQ